MEEMRKRLSGLATKEVHISGKCKNGKVFFFYSGKFQVNDRSLFGMGKEIRIDEIEEIKEFSTSKTLTKET